MHYDYTFDKRKPIGISKTKKVRIASIVQQRAFPMWSERVMRKHEREWAKNIGGCKGVGI